MIRRPDDGAAVVDFALVMLVLVPLFAAIVQLGFTLYVRNTVAACAQEGARYGADADFVSQGGDVVVAQATQRATTCVDSSLPARYAGAVSASPADSIVDGVAVPVVEVRIDAPVPVFGMWALGGATITVKGDALQEQLP